MKRVSESVDEDGKGEGGKERELDKAALTVAELGGVGRLRSGVHAERGRFSAQA